MMLPTSVAFSDFGRVCGNEETPLVHVHSAGMASPPAHERLLALPRKASLGSQRSAAMRGLVLLGLVTAEVWLIFTTVAGTRGSSRANAHATHSPA